MAARYPEDAMCQQQQDNNHHGRQHLSCLSEGQEFVSECEVLFEGEDDTLTTRYSECPKNPGHPTFIPVPDFAITHLPQELQTQENMDFIQQKIDRTVKIRVKYTSLNRPDVFSDRNAPYPFSVYKGNKKAVRYGTGSINRLLTPQPITDKPCPCHLCVKSGNPEKEHYLISVSTATHVIYDDSEAELATFDCFFDSDNATNVKTLYGVCIDGTNTSYDSMYKSDVSEVVCVTHDSETIAKICNVVFSNTNTFSVPHMYTAALPPEGVIVSHPHGCSKQITIGNVMSLTVPIKPSYDTCTPTPLPDGTICHINLTSAENDENRLTTLASALLKKPNLLLTADNPESEAKNQADQKSVLGYEDKSSQTTVCEVDATPTIKTQIEANQQSTSNVSDKNQNTPSKTSKQATTEFLDAVMEHVPVPSEFSYSSFDRAGMMEAIRTNIHDKRTPLHLLSLSVFNKNILNITQTSKPNSGKEFHVKEIDSSTKEDMVEFPSEIFNAYGVSDEIVVPIMEIMKGAAPQILDQNHTHNQQHSAWGEVFKNIFDKTISIGEGVTSNTMTDNNNVGGVNAILNKDILGDGLELEDSSNDGDDDDDDDNDNIHDMIQKSMQDVTKSLDITTKTLLNCMGLEDLALQMANMFGASRKPLPGDNFELPPGLKFILPPDAAYAMKYHREKPNWFTFPAGTKIINAIGEVIPLPEEVTFKNGTFYPQHSYISYDIDTCPGSSGATVYSNILGNEMMTFFPHSGSTNVCNISGVLENKLFSLTSHISQAMKSMFTKIVDIDLD